MSAEDKAVAVFIKLDILYFHNDKQATKCVL